MAASSIVLAGRYRLGGRIAVGGVGEVWRAADIALARPVAVKLLRAEFAGHQETRARFRAEARHAGALSHPGIARVYDYGEDDAPYLVMELVDGPSLAEVLAGGPLDAARTMRVVGEAAAGLAAAHAAGLVHRDVKPANLLISPGGQVKITDFGIAHAAGSAPLTRTGTVLGTPAYLAPERVAGASGTPAADLYALGVVAYECLAGVRPFAGDQLVVAAAHRYRPLPPLPAGVPEAVAALVTELTEKDPAARPVSAAGVAGRAGWLARVLGDGPAVALAGIAGPVSGPLPGTALQATLADWPLADGAAVGVPVADRPVAGGRVADGPVAGGRVADGPVAGGPDGPVPDRPLPWRPVRRPRRAWPARVVVLAMAAAVLVAGTAGWLLAAAFAAQPPAHPAAARAGSHQGGPDTRAGGAHGQSARPGTPAHSVTLGRAALAGRPPPSAIGCGEWASRSGSTGGSGRGTPAVRQLRPGGAVPPDSVVVLTGTAQPVSAGHGQADQRQHGGDGAGHQHGRGQQN